MLSDEQSLPAPGEGLSQSAPADGGRELPFGGGSRGAAAASSRGLALIEVILCSDIPTQLLIMEALGAAGIESRGADGRLSMLYVSLLSTLDAALLIGLIVGLLALHRERASALFLGRRRAGREAGLGLLLTPAVFLFALALLAVVIRFLPWLRNVPENPLADLIRTPRDAWIFGFVAVFAGGIREEIQRAFILRRFEQHLGGAVVGLVVFSLAFGAGHVIQGWDVAIITASLGAIWGVVYLWRRSIVAPVVSHSLFNVGQIVQHTVFAILR
jgi:membrane protease YdiL (CAAX protease family)